MTSMRADQLLVARGLARSRAQAQAAIEAGCVTADGRLVRRAAERLDAGAALTFEPAHPFVSRGGVKLAAALDAFGIDAAGRHALDLGASTGGFTDVLLRRGVAHVTAVDVGRGQFDATLAADPRVRLFEGLDARALTADHLPHPVDLIVADLSFIGLAKALPPALALAGAPCDLVALIKPQFEAGPGARPGGIVPDDEALALAEQVAADLDGLSGFTRLALIESPLRGGEGQREFLLHARRGVGMNLGKAPPAPP